MNVTVSNARQSFNNGFWDGFHDAESYRQPVWEGRTHPNPDYYAGYKRGVAAYRDNFDPPESSDSAWSKYQTAKMVGLE